MKISAGELALMVNGVLEGDPTMILTQPSKIEEGVSGSVCFLANLKYEHFLYETKASLVIVDQHFVPKSEITPALLRVENVYLTVSHLLSLFDEPKESISGINPQSNIHPSAQLGQKVSIGAFTILELDVVVGESTIIHPQVYIGPNVKIGAHTVIYPGVRVYRDCVIGDRCVIHANAIIGSDGFGFSPDPSGNYQKIAQVGNVELKDDVEIGANTTIDRGTMGSTLIGRGSKLDNLIQIAHNVQIGEHTVIAAQAGIAGSAKIGNRCMIGGQVGIAGHLQVADGTMIQAQSGIASSLKEENGKWYGSPAIDYYSYLRAYAAFKKLPDLVVKVKELEALLEASKKPDETI